MWLRPLVVGLDNTNYAMEVVKGIIPVQILQISRMILGFFYPRMELWPEILDMLLQERYKRVIVLTDNLEVVQILSDLDLKDFRITVLRRTQCIMRAERMWKIK
ncbi:hypothetical protein Gotur_012329, partial [Gossypium turneri]